MNPDLAMAQELLKKTRTGNLFTVFGQPDIEIRPVAGGAGGSRSRSTASTSTTPRLGSCAATRPSHAPSRALTAAGSRSR
jgi:adenine-specific DNA-methyltransferase